MVIVFVSTNKINGKQYLGKCVHSKPFYLGSGIALKSAIKKYGRENFSKRILYDNISKDLAAKIERELSIEWNVVQDPLWYNMKTGGDGGSVRGVKRSEETRKKISESKQGTQPWNLGLSGTNLVKHTQETKEKIRFSNTGKIHTRDHKLKISQSHIGKTHTPETKEKMRLARLGKSPWNKGLRFNEK